MGEKLRGGTGEDRQPQEPQALAGRLGTLRVEGERGQLQRAACKATICKPLE